MAVFTPYYVIIMSFNSTWDKPTHLQNWRCTNTLTCYTLSRYKSTLYILARTVVLSLLYLTYFYNHAHAVHVDTCNVYTLYMYVYMYMYVDYRCRLLEIGHSTCNTMPGI